MKHPPLLALLAALFVGCSKSSAPTDTSASAEKQEPRPADKYPTLVIDDQHQMNGKEPPTPYQIAATPGIRLDAGQFRFTYGTNALKPNMVQLVLDKSVYRLSIPTEAKLYVIDLATLEGAQGEIFHGFRSGDHIMFFIGRSTRGAEKEEFWVSWAGQIEVK